MKYLIDTHILLWLTTDDTRLSKEVKKIVESPTCCISSVSLWEIAIKFSIGKLSLDGGLEYFLNVVNDLGFERMDISDSHLTELSKLQILPEHKDPFDRLLIAQTIAEELQLVTADEQLKKYGVKLLFN